MLRALLKPPIYWIKPRNTFVTTSRLKDQQINVIFVTSWGTGTSGWKSQIVAPSVEKSGIQDQNPKGIVQPL
jgi:hypothetical protein